MTITYLLAGFIWGLVLLCLVKYLTDNGRFWLNNEGLPLRTETYGGGDQRSRNPQAAMRAITNSPLLNSAPKVNLDKTPPYSPRSYLLCPRCRKLPDWKSGSPLYSLPPCECSINDSPDVATAPPKPIELFSCGNNAVDPYGPGQREYELDTIIIDSLADLIKDSPDSDKAPYYLPCTCLAGCASLEAADYVPFLFYAGGDSIKDSPEIVVSEPESCQVLDKGRVS